jgi:hypothetical protein
MDLDTEQRLNLLEATLREIVRLYEESRNDPAAIGADDLFDDPVKGRAWQRALANARRLTSTP